MNFPVGGVTTKGDVPFDLVVKVQEFLDSRFNGYIILSVKGTFIEEGALFFKDGVILACVVECLGAEAIVKGTDALPYFFNETRGFGFFQCVSLTKSQVDLVTAFDEKLLTNKIDLKDVPRMIPSVFSPRFNRVQTQKSALEAYGLGELKV